MRYFHRTTIPIDAVLEEADTFFGERLEPTERGPHRRGFRGTIGELTVTVNAEGGHYTLVTVGTDQLAESEADNLAKRFLSVLHRRSEPTHQVRGAY